ncbi:MAG: hypothetical protein ACXIUQ_15835 [Cecembia sp.]
MKKLIFYLLVFCCLIQKAFPQSSLRWFVPIAPGIQTDIPNGEAILGMSLGVGVDFSGQPNRWQLTLDIAMYSTQDLNELSYHGFKSWTSSIKFGRMWETGIAISGNKLHLGAGGLVISSLQSNVAPGLGNTVSYPGGGIYGRAFYPILHKGNRLMLMFEPSLFGEGFWRNQLGMVYYFK